MNKLILIVVISLFSLSVFAETYNIGFQGKNFYYRTNIDEVQAKIKGSLINLSIKETKCNRLITKSFHSKLKKYLRTKVIEKNKTKAHVTEINGKIYYLAKESSLGRFLYQLPNIFKGLKKREQIICK